MRIRSLTIIILLVLQSLLQAEITVSARFNPPRIAMGDRAQYIVEIQETTTDRQPQAERVNSLPIPTSGGLNLSNGRTSSRQQTRIINGAAQYTVTQSLIIDAAPPSVGSFTIPGFAFEYKGQRLNAPAATLQVLERSADAGPSRDELIFLKANLPENLYVGQSIPVDLKLYIAEGVRLSGLHSFDRSADGFTLSELPQNSDESTELYEGRRYRVLTWPMRLTPIQTGSQTINFQFSLSAQLPGNNQSRDSFGRSPFGRSLFDDFFGRTERLNVYTDEMEINVLPVPSEGQPDSFSGAIGNFSLEVGSDSESTVEGEPIMLSVVIRGEGNFERIDGPAFRESPDWRHYDPEENFEPSDALGLRGSQRYDYVFIPRRSGDLQLPETFFSYFDPEKKEYVELKAPAIDVAVSPAQRSFAPPPTSDLPETEQPDRTLSRTLTAEEALLTLDYRPKAGHTLGTAILQSPGFIAANALAALGIAAAALTLRRIKANREDPSSPIRQSARKALAENKKAFTDALGRKDADSFYKHALAAIRNAATVRTAAPMQGANAEQIASLLEGNAKKSCRELFAAAEANRFGRSETQRLDESSALVGPILQALEK
jgi:hypothetical protein